MRTLFDHDCGAITSSAQVATGRGFWAYNGTIGIASNLGRGGNTPVLQINNSTGEGSNKVVAKIANTNTIDVYARFRISRASGTPHTNNFYIFKVTDWQGNIFAGLRGTGAGSAALDLLSGGSTLMNNVVTVNTTQQVVELYTKPKTDGTGVLTVRIDGSEVYTSSTLTYIGEKPVLVHFANMYSLNLYLQDILVQDTNGDALTWLGVTAFNHYDLPTGDGAQVDFTADGGGAHYVNVDDNPSNDATDKCRSINTNNSQNVELFTFPSLPADTGSVFAMGVRATGNPVTSGSGYYLEGRCRSPGGSQYQVGYESKVGPAGWQSLCLGFLDYNPNVGAWTKSTAESFQFGVRHVSS